MPFSCKLTESETEVFNPPKLTDNSVLLYQSTTDYSSKLRSLRTFELPGLVFLGLFYPYVSELFFVLGVFYAIVVRGIVYEPTRRLVVRMDLLPDSETLYIQKIGLGGFIYGETVLLDELDRFEAYDVQDKGRIINF